MGDIVTDDLVLQLRANLAADVRKKPPHVTYGDSPFDYVRALRYYNDDIDAATKYMKQTLRCQAVAPHAKPIGGFARDVVSVGDFGHVTPLFPPCFSKEGHMLRCEMHGRLDPLAFMQDAETDWVHMMQFQQHVRCTMYDIVSKREIETGKEGGIHIIWDLDQLNGGVTYFIRHLVDPVWQCMEFQENDNHGMTKRTTVINAPKLFSKMWSAVKPLLAENFRKSVNILSDNWRPEILKEFEEEELPEFMGGKRKIDTTDDYQFSCPFIVRTDRKKEDIDYKAFGKYKVGRETCLTATVRYQGTEKATLKIYFVCDASMYLGAYRHDEPDKRIEPFEDELVMSEIHPYPVSSHAVEKIGVGISKPGYYKVCFYNPQTRMIYSNMNVYPKVCIEDSKGKTITKAEYGQAHYDKAEFHY